MKATRALMLLVVLAALVGCGHSGNGGGGVDSSIPFDALEYTVQKVCVENPTKDPFTCETTRPLRPGEFLYYSKINQPGEQIGNSFPHPRSSNPCLVVHTFDYKNDGGDFHTWDTKKDGYDLSGCDGEKVAFLATRHSDELQGISWLQKKDSGECVQGGWTIFPRFFSGSLPGRLIAFLRGELWERSGVPYPGLCRGTDVSALTEWRQEMPTYLNGRTLPTKISIHYDDDSPEKAKAREEFWFTPLLGKVLWKAWEKNTSKLPVPEWWCSGPKVDGPWTTVDCHEWTKILLHPNLPFNPADWPVPLPVP